jgi:phospholipid/cholesterol/gamma-HCH transport system substrate-binding protein
MGLFGRSRTHREPTQRELALQGVVFIVVMVLLGGMLSMKLKGEFGDTIPVSAQLQTVGGSLRPGVDVKMRGMAVGKVGDLQAESGHVNVDLNIERRHADRIPSNVQARVLPASVFGTSYVDLVIPDAAGGASPIRAGDIVRQDSSQGTVELQTALDSIDQLVDALGPSELATALHTAASVLDGRGEDLGEAIDQFTSYIDKFEPMFPKVREDLRLLAVNLNAVARNAPDLLEATDDGRITLNKLVKRQKKLEKLLDGGAALMSESNAFFVGHEASYLKALGISVTLVQALYDSRDGLRDTLLETGNVTRSLLTVLETATPGSTATSTPVARTTTRLLTAPSTARPGGTTVANPLNVRIRPVYFMVIGFFTLSAILLLLLANTMADEVDGETVPYTARFSQVSGLRTGDDVRVAGVQVGKVTSVEVDPATRNTALVGFTLRTDQPLRSNASLVMRYQNLLGQRYLSLVQPRELGPVVVANSVVPLDRTSDGFDLTELLNGFRPLFDVLQPADVNKLTESVIKVLQGEGGTVASLLDQTAELTNFLADRDQLFGAVFDNLTPVLVDLAGQGDELRDTIQALSEFMEGLAEERKTFGKTIADISKVVDTTDEFLGTIREPATENIQKTKAVLRMYAAEAPRFGQSIDDTGSLMESLGRVLSYRNGLTNYFCALDLDLGGGLAVRTSTLPTEYSEVCR